MLRKVQEPLVASSGTPMQWGALAALDAGERAGIERMRETYRRRRDLAMSILGPAGLADYEPEGAFYIMADISTTGLTGDEFALRLLKEERVAVAPGSGFALVPEYAPDGTLMDEPTEAGAPGVRDAPRRSLPRAHRVLRVGRGAARRPGADGADGGTSAPWIPRSGCRPLASARSSSASPRRAARRAPPPRG
jgi:hypothetical protein